MLLRFRIENFLNQIYFIIFILQLSCYKICYRCEISANLPPCPCNVPKLIEKSSLSKFTTNNLCILDKEKIIRSQAYSYNWLNVVVFHSESLSSKCNAILKLSLFDKMKVECPGKCVPVPVIEISYNSFFSLNNSRNSNMILCSLSSDHILNSSLSDRQLRDKQDRIVSLLPILSKIYFRRLSECFEHSHEYLVVESNNHLEFSRKRIEGLFIWIGTVNRIDIMRAQATVIQELTTDSSSNSSQNKKLSSIAWLATEEIYGCRTGTTGCRARVIPPRRKGGKKLFHYNNEMPFTRIPKSSAGWNCAQRRPLRVLAHTLKLFDPTFLVLLDDDTYLNIPLFSTHLLPRLTSVSTDTNTPVLLGEFMDPGHVSENGFLVGGAGYFMNAATLALLTSHKVLDVPMESPYSGAYSQSYSLSLLREARVVEKFHSCHNVSLHLLPHHLISADNSDTQRDRSPSNTTGNTDHRSASLHPPLLFFNSTATSPSDPNNTNTTFIKYIDMRCEKSDGKPSRDDKSLMEEVPPPEHPKKNLPRVDINVRLIDLCTKLLSGENTCHHSDHAVSRCLFYGAGVKAKGLVCNAAKYPGHFGVGLCHEVNQICDTNFHVTCHRWKPENELTFRPVRIYNDSGFYDEFSTGNDQENSFGRFDNRTAYG